MPLSTVPSTAQYSTILSLFDMPRETQDEMHDPQGLLSSRPTSLLLQRSEEHGPERTEKDERPDEFVSDDIMPAIVELLVLDELEPAQSDKGNGKPHNNDQDGHSSAPSSRNSMHARQSSLGKAMSETQFEMYRRARDMHRNDLSRDGDDSPDEYEDDTEDEEQQKLARQKQRRQQEAYLVSRRERVKVSGGDIKKMSGSDTDEEVKKVLEADKRISQAFESWNTTTRTPSPSVEVHQAHNDADDDDIPLALLKRTQTPSFPEALDRKHLGPKENRSRHRHHLSASHFVERPQTRLRSHSPGPTLQPMSRLGPIPQQRKHHSNHRQGASMNLNMSMGNSSLLSLASQPQMPRPHSSGGLINAIDHLQSPSPYNQYSGPPKDFLGMPVNPPKFYGRWT